MSEILWLTFSFEEDKIIISNRANKNVTNIFATNRLHNLSIKNVSDHQLLTKIVPRDKFSYINLSLRLICKEICLFDQFSIETCLLDQFSTKTCAFDHFSIETCLFNECRIENCGFNQFSTAICLKDQFSVNFL